MSSMDFQALMNQVKELVKNPQVLESMLDAAGMSPAQKKTVMSSVNSINTQGSLTPAGMQSIMQVIQQIMTQPNANLQGLGQLLNTLNQNAPNETAQKNLEMLLKQLGNRR